MRTSASQLRWIGMWIIRILFFPLWILVVWRRHIRELAASRCKCTVNWLGDKITTKCPEHRKVDIERELNKIYKIQDREVEDGDNDINYQMHLLKYPKKDPEPEPSYWALQILDKRGCILGQMAARMVDEEEGLILYADFDICTSITIVKSRVLRRGKTVGTVVLPSGPISALKNDLVKIRHALHVEVKKPKPFVEPAQGLCGMSDCQNIVVYGDRLRGSVICNTCAAKQKEYADIDPDTWMGKKIYDLDDKHLWNIVQAVNNGHWASGKPTNILPKMKAGILDEYAKRCNSGLYSKKKIKKIEKKNKKYEEKYLKKTGKEYRA